MPHKRSYRLGWQSENLASFILYKFSFVAHPSKVADDIGVDFFCTLFETQRHGRNANLIPRNSFAIQIKSDTGRVDLSKYLCCLDSLEIPFFIGVVSRSTLSLAIFSGEYLTPFFSFKGIPEYLEADLCNRNEIDGNQWFSQVEQRYILKFPHIATITAQMEDNTLAPIVRLLWEICSLIRDNIASRVNKEYTFKIFDSEEVLTFSGPDSIKHVHQNLFNRLAEVFDNLNWVSQHEEVRQAALAEFRLYENIFVQIASFYSADNLPQYLKAAFDSAKSKMESLEQDIEVG